MPTMWPTMKKGARVSQLVDLQRRITLERNRELIGLHLPILIERDATKSAAQGMGKTDGNITVVWDKGTDPFVPGALVTKRIIDASAATLYGV